MLLIIIIIIIIIIIVIIWENVGLCTPALKLFNVAYSKHRICPTSTYTCQWCHLSRAVYIFGKNLMLMTLLC